MHLLATYRPRSCYHVCAKAEHTLYDSEYLLLIALVVKGRTGSIYNCCSNEPILELACPSGLRNCHDYRHTLPFSTNRCQSQRVEHCRIQEFVDIAVCYVPKVVSTREIFIV
jgi:hypothetical protein